MKYRSFIMYKNKFARKYRYSVKDCSQYKVLIVEFLENN